MGVQASFNGTDFTLMKQVLLLFQPGWGASVDTRPFNGTCFVFISVKIWKGGGSPPPPDQLRLRRPYRVTAAYSFLAPY